MLRCDRRSLPPQQIGAPPSAVFAYAVPREQLAIVGTDAEVASSLRRAPSSAIADGSLLANMGDQAAKVSRWRRSRERAQHEAEAVTDVPARMSGPHPLSDRRRGDRLR
jgi:hypothetical protein